MQKVEETYWEDYTCLIFLKKENTISITAKWRNGAGVGNQINKLSLAFKVSVPHEMSSLFNPVVVQFSTQQKLAGNHENKVPSGGSITISKVDKGITYPKLWWLNFDWKNFEEMYPCTDKWWFRFKSTVSGDVVCWLGLVAQLLWANQWAACNGFQLGGRDPCKDTILVPIWKKALYEKVGGGSILL